MVLLLVVIAGTAFLTGDIQNNTTNINKTRNIDNDWYVYSGGNTIIVNSNKTSGKIEIYDNTGRKVSEKYVNCGETTFSINESGLYFIRYTHNGIYSVKKVIVSLY